MYKPSFFNEDDPQKIHQLIDENPFATLISFAGGKPLLSHLPFLRAEKDGKEILYSHMARANTHWMAFGEDPKVRVVFQGPHAYISPGWYPPSPSNVPTWNYTAVHVHGVARVIDELPSAWRVMEKLIESNEEKYGVGWRADKTGVTEKISRIVVFEIEIRQFDAKFKLSQQQDQAVRENVSRELLRSSIQAFRGMGNLMADKHLGGDK